MAFPHIYEAIRGHAPFSVELAFRAAFRTPDEAKRLHPILLWPRRVILSRSAAEAGYKPTPEITGPNGELIVPHHHPADYAAFARLVREHAHRLKDVRVLDIVDDIGRQAARPVLRATTSNGKPEKTQLRVIRFVPELLPFTTRTWLIDTRKVVVFMKIPLPPKSSRPHHYFLSLPNMLRLDLQSTAKTLVINVRFMDEDHPITATYDEQPYSVAKHLHPDVVLIFADALEAHSRFPKALTEGQKRFQAVKAAVSEFIPTPHAARRCSSVTLVGVDEIDRAMFGLSGHEIPSEHIYHWHHRYNKRHYCRQNKRQREFVCQPGACPHLKFYTVEQYKALIGSAEFAVETVC